MKTILVIGEECEDVFQYGRCARLNPEAPTPVFNPGKTVKARGMAANVYLNIKQMIEPGTRVDIIRQELVDMKKTRFVDESSNYILLRVDTNDRVEELVLTDEIRERITLADCVIVSDYNKGFLSHAVLSEISKLAKVSFIDTKKEFGAWIEDFTWIKVNRKEFSNPQHDPITQAKIFDKTVITLGEGGASVGANHIKPSLKSQVIDVCGAGDTFLAGLVSNYLKTSNIISAIEFANLCAGQAVSQRGVVSVNGSI